MKTFICETGVSAWLHCQRKMNNYISFLLEADAAKKRLAQWFKSGPPEKITHPSSAFAVFDFGRAGLMPGVVSRIREPVLERGQQKRP
jgi:hypothetical protein